MLAAGFSTGRNKAAEAALAACAWLIGGASTAVSGGNRPPGLRAEAASRRVQGKLGELRQPRTEGNARGGSPAQS